MKIKLVKSELKRIGSNLESISNDLQAESRKINIILADITEAWEGKDATTFLNIMQNKYLPDLKKASSVIEKQAEYLKKVPDNYDKIDSKFSSIKIK